MSEAKCPGITKAGIPCKNKLSGVLTTCHQHLTATERERRRVQEENERLQRQQQYRQMLADAQARELEARQARQARRPPDRNAVDMNDRIDQAMAEAVRIREHIAAGRDKISRQQQELENEISKYRTLTRTMRFKEELMMFYWHPDRYDKWSFQEDD